MPDTPKRDIYTSSSVRSVILVNAFGCAIVMGGSRILLNPDADFSTSGIFGLAAGLIGGAVLGYSIWFFDNDFPLVRIIIISVIWGLCLAMALPYVLTVESWCWVLYAMFITLTLLTSLKQITAVLAAWGLTLFLLCGAGMSQIQFGAVGWLLVSGLIGALAGVLYVLFLEDRSDSPTPSASRPDEWYFDDDGRLLNESEE